MELKVWVEGIQRIVCGVTEKTTCQDVVYALAHATGKTGRFTLIERWRNNERLLAPQENPLKVLQKWGEYAADVQFILQRSALDSMSSLGSKSGQLPVASFSPTANRKPMTKDHQPQQPAAVWKPPPPTNPRLSPDSGRGSDRTVGSDTSYSDKEQQSRGGRVSSQGHPYSGYNPNGATSQMNGYRYPSGPPPTTNGYPPAYRPPPQPVPRNSSPAASSSASEFPPPYRNPPPPPRYRNGTNYPVAPGSGGVVRPPHYSPPPTHRNALSRHPSRSSLIGSSTRSMNQHGLPAPPNGSRPVTSRSSSNMHHRQNQYNKGIAPSDLHELMNLVSAQQSTLYSQQAEIKQCDAETTYLENFYQQQQHPAQSSSTSNLRNPLAIQNGTSLPSSMSSGSLYQQSEGQIDLVLSEVRRLEEVAQRNEDELHVLSVDGNHQLIGGGKKLMSNSKDDENLIKSELSHLKQRLAGTDQELQKTNYTLRRLGDEMRSMSMEKNRQREQELSQEIERLHNEIKLLQRNSEEGATLSQQLSKEVKDVEDQISQRKAEVEKLIKEMRDANMESLAISPPEESKQFVEGPMKPGSQRKMLSSPRALESAVPTAKNPHGVWV